MKILEMKNCNMILNKTHKKYQHYRLEKYKYEYLTGAEILFFDQRRAIEKATITYSPLGRTFEKQTKLIKDRRKKQIKALKMMENN